MTDVRGSQRTRASLILRLKEQPGDQAAWREFVRRYEPKLRDWCRHWRLQEADASDVVQLVMLNMLSKLRGFDYDASRTFRGWLKTLAHNTWCDVILRRRQLRTNLGVDKGIDPLDSLTARDDLETRLEEAFDLELLELAKDNVQARVAPHTWEAFRLMAEENLSGTEVSVRLDMPLQSIFKAKQNVEKMLRAEVEKLG